LHHRSLSLVILFFLLLFPQTLRATGLIEIFQQAQKNDPLLQTAYFKNQGVQERRKQAVALLLPTLAGSADTGRTFQNIRNSDNDVFQAGRTDFGTTTYGLTLTQPVFHWESIVGLQQANADILRSEAEYRIAGQDLIIRVADLYMKVLAARDQLTFAKAEQHSVEKHFELASNQFSKGLIPITDMHDAKARKATVSAQVIEAENLMDDALQALQEMTGAPVAEVETLKPDIPLASPDPAEMDTWIQAALRQNPAIHLQKYAVEVASKEVDRQHAAHLPSVDLVGSYNNEDTQGSLFGGGSNVDTSRILVRLNVPLYQGGLVTSRVSEAEHQLSAVRQELIRQKRAVERQTRGAFLGVKSAINRVEALQQSVASNQLALEAKQEGFLSGLYTSLAVLDADRDLYLTKQEYAKARYEYLLNSLKLKKATDTLTGSDLQQLAQLFR
jgi:outer membrane protein